MKCSDKGLIAGFGGAAVRILAMMLFVLPVAVNARTWPSTVGEGSISRWHGDRVSAFTVTIDDNHAPDHEFWKGLGSEYGLKWTWCVITGNVGSDGSTWAGWQEIVDLGHGIASHGLTAYDIASPPANITNEYSQSQQALRDNLTGVDALTMAYPNGLHPEDPEDPNDKDLAAVYYIAARGVFGGVNTGDSIDYMDPKSVSMNATTVVGMTDPGVWHYYGHAINPSHGYYEGWQSVHFHSVLESMKVGLTNLVVALQSNAADIWTGRFQDVAQYGQEREDATLTVTSVSGSEIRFTVTDTLDDTLFYFPLTVKIRVDSSWNGVAATQDGQAVSAEIVEYDGNKYALVQAIPDQGEVTLGPAAGADGLLVVVRGLSHDRVWVDENAAGPVYDGTYNAPYKTVQAGLNAAAPGEIVTVREGTYRELVTLLSGAPGQPITLSSAPGERVVLSAMATLSGWSPETGGIYSTIATWEPDALYSGFQKMVQAREPNEGWWEADGASEDVSGGTFTITNTNLTGFPHDLTNASVYIWTQSDDRFYTCPIVSSDPVSGSVEFENVNPAMAVAAGDKFWLQNQLSLIDQPNEWASEPDGADFLLYYYPSAPADLAETQIPPAAGRTVSGQNVAHIRLNDLEVVGGDDRGIYLNGVQDVEINRCIVHNNMLFGLWLDSATNCSVQGSIFKNNRFGVVVSESASILIEGNEIGANEEDGLVFSQNSSNLFVRSNYIHDHLMWGHPDNSQTYLGVEDIHFQDNLIMTAVQSVMMEDTTEGEFSGNMLIGSGANMLNFGHGNASNFVVRGNTLAFAGYNCLGMTAQNYEVKDNVFVSGHGAAMYTVSDTMDYDGDHNLFWNGAGLVDPVILVSDGAWGGGSVTSGPFSIEWDNNDIMGAATAPADVVPAGVSVSDLACNNLTVYTSIQNGMGARVNAHTSSLADEISASRYFSVTITPDSGVSIDFDSIGFEGTVWDWTGIVGSNNLQVSVLSSLTGSEAGDVLDTLSLPSLGNGAAYYDQFLDVSGVAALDDVTEAVEFRFYVVNGADPATAFSFGHHMNTDSNPGTQDLEFNGTISSAGGGGGGTPETIYHTDLADFQSTTGLELNSTNSDPLFANAPVGINVMDTALLDEATRDTFALRGINHFSVDDHVEINFDGVVRTVTASSGAVITVDPALDAKPLKGYLVANWGTSTNFVLDLALQPSSPGTGLAEGGGNAGSAISVQQFKSGDFDGDGRRDIPVCPVELTE